MSAPALTPRGPRHGGGGTLRLPSEPQNVDWETEILQGRSQQAQPPRGHWGGLGCVGRGPFSSGHPRLPMACVTLLCRSVPRSTVQAHFTHMWGPPPPGSPPPWHKCVHFAFTNKGYSWLEIGAAIEQDSMSHGGVVSPAVLLGSSISWSPWRTHVHQLGWP